MVMMRNSRTYNNNNYNDNAHTNDKTGNNHNTGVCKINGVVIVVNCCYSIGFSITNNNKNTVFFCNHNTNKNDDTQE